MEPAKLETVTQPPSPARDGAKASTARPERNSVVPPYWRKHERNVSRLSSYSDNGHPTPIGLEDHTDEDSEHCKVLWAKGVTIDDHVVVSGTAPGLGAYVVWNCTVETLDVSFPSRIHADARTANRLNGSFPKGQLRAERFLMELGDCSMLPILGLMSCCRSLTDASRVVP